MSEKKNYKPKFKSPSAKTPNQKSYIKSILNNDVVICQGPAGTGKTHLAVGMAVMALRKAEVERIIIARPIVEAGESLGSLPGEIENKMNPFLRPCLDELLDFSSYSEISQWQNDKTVEIAPIAYMRGRTFKNAFIVCDECQNLSYMQTKMLMTRFGQNAKMVLTGDASQSDLTKDKQGAFAYLCQLFETLPEDGVEVVRMDKSDNQRHELVGKIEEKWEKHLDVFQKTGKIA